MAKNSRSKNIKRLNLALQGGGAHGAFTWGVLDRLLDEEDIEIEGVSATSAGAMNGAMFTTGVKVGGREEARKRLTTFWGEIRDAYPLNQLPWSIWAHAFEVAPAWLNSAFALQDAMSLVVSPYQALHDINPLREVLERLIDFSKVCRDDDPRLFVCATDVATGGPEIFRGDRITIDALLASACLPTLYKAVEIEGREYWDGGYSGNPAIWPLIYNCDTPDVLIVHINPIHRPEPPRDARSIQNRINEISFNSNLLAELRAINAVETMLKAGRIPEGRFKRMRIHAVEDEATMLDLTAASKRTPEARLLDRLFEAGRTAMDHWLDAHKDKIGVESSVDIREKYL